MPTVNTNTQISISLGKFLSLIGSLLVIIFGFYKLVILPDIEGLKEENSKSIEELKIKYDETNRHIIQINNSIGVINGNIQGINQRFGDLRMLNSANRNTGGGVTTQPPQNSSATPSGQ
jgi:hypothetical protein